MLYEKTGWFGGRKRAVGWGVAGLVAVAAVGGPAVGVSVLIVPVRKVLLWEGCVKAPSE